MGVMGEIGIHFKDKSISFVNGPLEAIDIRGSQPLFALPDFQEKFIWIFMLQITNDVSRSIRRTIIYDENMVILFKRKYGLQNGCYIFLFVVGWYDC